VLAVRLRTSQRSSRCIPVHSDLRGFDFGCSSVDQALIDRLHAGRFIDTCENVVLGGGLSTGKTHLATAIGIEAVRSQQRRVRFLSTVELVNALEQEKARSKAGQIALRLTYADLVILDELGYLLFTPSGGALLFRWLSKRYERLCPEIKLHESFNPLIFRGFQPWSGCSCWLRLGRCMSLIG
jgi:DNA replication protein DnaC